MSRSPLSKKDNYSKLHAKSQDAVPKRFPPEFLKPKTNQPIDSIHKIWNFVKSTKTNDVNKSTHLTSVSIPEPTIEHKNFSFSKNADPMPLSRDKTPPPHMQNSKSGTNLQAHGRPPSSEAQGSNFRPFLYSKSNQNSHHERKVSDVPPRSVHRLSPSKGSRPQSISNGNIFLVPSQQQDRYHRTKHNSYASIYAQNHQADHSTRDISSSYMKERRKENASHSKSKSSITPMKNENPSPEFNFESPLSSNRKKNDRSLSRGHSRGNPSVHSPMDERGPSVDRRLKYTPNAMSQPQSIWEPNQMGVENDMLEISSDSLLNRSVLDGQRMNIDKEANIRDNNKNPNVKSLNLQKLKDMGEEQAYLDPGNHFRSFSGNVNSQIHQKENISADRYMYEFKQQAVPKNSNPNQQSTHHLASASIDQPKSIYHQVMEERKKLSGYNSASHIPTGASQKSSRSGNSIMTASDQHNNPPQNGLAFTFQNYMALKVQNKPAPAPSKSTHTSHIEPQPGSRQHHHSIDSWNNNVSMQRQAQQRQQQQPKQPSLSNLHHSVNHPMEVVDPFTVENNETIDNADNPFNSRVKRTTLHNYRTHETYSSQQGKLPTKSSSRSNLLNPDPKPSSGKHRRNPVHQSMGQISQSFSQDTRAGAKNSVRAEAYSSNTHSRSPDLHSKNPGAAKPQSKLLNNFIKDLNAGPPPSHTRQKTLATQSNSMLGVRSSKDQISKRSFDSRINFDEALAFSRDKSTNQIKNNQEFGIETFSRIDLGGAKAILTPFRAEDESKEFIYDRDPEQTHTPRMVIPEPGESYMYKNPLELSSLQNETLSQLEEDYSVKISKDFPLFSPPDIIGSITRNSPEKQMYESSGREKPKHAKLLIKEDKYFQKEEYSFEFEDHNQHSNLSRAQVSENIEKIVKRDSPIRTQVSKESHSDLRSNNLFSSPSDRNYEKSLSPERARKLLEERVESDRAFSLKFAGAFKGHRNTVTSLVRDPTNNSIFSGSLDGTILHWDGQLNSSSYSGRETRAIMKGVTTYKKPIHSLIYNPFNRSIISGSSDSTIRVWNSQSYECSRILRGHTGGVFSLVALNAQQLVSGSGDQQIKIWDLEKGSLLNSFQDHTNRVTSLCRVGSNDNFTFLSGSVDSTLKLWDSRINKCAAVFKEHEGTIHAIINIDDNQVATAGADGRIIIWDMLHRRIKDQYNLDAEIFSLAYYKPAEKLFAGTEKLNAISLNKKAIESIEDPSSHTGSIKSLLVDCNLDRLYSGSFDTEIKTWFLKRSSY